MRLVLVGPPGAGKGTQAAVIAAKIGVPAISTGDIFRANVGQETPLGLEAKQYMDAGQLVPDAVTNAMVADRLTHADVSIGFLLDGYPRNLDQADVLTQQLEAAHTPLDAVIEIVADTEHVLARLLSRGQGRADDTEEVIRHRLDVYASETAPLVGYYRERGVLRTVVGIGSVDEVTARILAVLPA
ncbi:MAG: adenylate kinase [Actinomycetia bacterium]|nr:adenylate kinase [Actinomycetes bacterium]